MTAALWPSLVSGLVSAWTASAPAGWQVWDGKPLTWDQLERGVAVGVEAALEDGQSGSVRQEWRDAGPAPLAARQESGSVTCAMWIQDGGEDIAGLRSQLWDCLTVLTGVAIQIEPLGVDGLTWVSCLSQARPLQRWMSDGCLVAVEFDVAYSGLTY